MNPSSCLEPVSYQRFKHSMFIIWITNMISSNLILILIFISNVNLLENFIGLRFYDLKTNKTLTPPMVTPFNSLYRLPIIGQPCSCLNLNCGCCAGMNIEQFNFNQNLCTNFTYDPQEFAIGMEVLMNENSVYQNQLSAKNPPPLCAPIPVPYIPISMDLCVKMFNIFTPGKNLHMCMDILARIEHAPVLVLHFDCMRMGVNGLALVKPFENGGLPIDVIQPGMSDGPEQTDSDIFDIITEIKNIK